jgi:kynureninase
VIEEVGVEAIRERSLALTDLIVRLVDDAGFEVTSQRDQARRGASVTIRTPGFEGVHKELSERQILCDFRPDVGLRLGPHFFNTEDELEFAVGQIAEIVASGVHERHLGAAARF